MNKDTHNIANNYFTLLTEAKKKVRPPTKDELTDPLFAYGYALSVLKGQRFPEAEPVIAKDPHIAFKYARDVIKNRWPEGEEAIFSNPHFKHFYVEFLNDIEHPEDEDNEEQDEDVINDPIDFNIMTDGLEEIDAYLGYASYHKKRWPELEKVLLDNYLFDQAIFYLMEILKKRWPELEEILYDPNNNDPHFNFPHLRKQYEDALKHINYEDED